MQPIKARPGDPGRHLILCPRGSNLIASLAEGEAPLRRTTSPPSPDNRHGHRLLLLLGVLQFSNRCSRAIQYGRSARAPRSLLRVAAERRGWATRRVCGSGEARAAAVVTPRDGCGFGTQEFGVELEERPGSCKVRALLDRVQRCVCLYTANGYAPLTRHYRHSTTPHCSIQQKQSPYTAVDAYNTRMPQQSEWMRPFGRVEHCVCVSAEQMIAAAGTCALLHQQPLAVHLTVPNHLLPSGIMRDMTLGSLESSVVGGLRKLSGDVVH